VGSIAVLLTAGGVGELNSLACVGFNSTQKVRMPNNALSLRKISQWIGTNHLAISLEAWKAESEAGFRREILVYGHHEC
jgi:hypothetical protein